jgi:hypothetical protein
MATDDVVTIELTEQLVSGKRLGRHVRHDPRSWNFQAKGAPSVKSVTHQATGLPLNQAISVLAPPMHSAVR